MQARPILLSSLLVVVGCGGDPFVDEELAEGDEVLETMEGNLTSCVTVGTNLITTAAINFRSGPSTQPPGEPGLLEVPYISQFRPNGADSDYFNGSANCGPTSMAMIGRFYGYGSGMTDAQLVTHLNLADGKATGATNADGIKKMAAILGKPVAHRLGADLAFVDRSLADGKPVTARGIFTSVRHHRVRARRNGERVQPVRTRGRSVRAEGDDRATHTVAAVAALVDRADELSRRDAPVDGEAGDGRVRHRALGRRAPQAVLDQLVAAVLVPQLLEPRWNSRWPGPR